VRVLFDARPLQSQSAFRGIGRYAFELIAALARRAPDVEFTFLRDPRARQPRLPEGVPRRWLNFPISAPEQLRGYLDALWLPRLLARAPIDLYHSPEYGQPLRSRTPVVVSVHDLIPWIVRHPSYLRQRARWGLQVRLLARAHRLVCDSHATREALLAGRNVDAARTRVVYPGISSFLRERPAPEQMDAIRRRFGGHFALMVGECDWRKRAELAIAAVAQCGDPALRLVVVGPNRRHAPRLRRQASAAGMSERFALAGPISDAELLAAYTTARMLLFPSSYEGFGLPALEALATGLPVVAYDNSAIPEVLGEDAGLLPDGDLDAFVARVRAILADPGRRWNGPHSMERARAFTWGKTAEGIHELYREILAPEEPC